MTTIRTDSDNFSNLTSTQGTFVKSVASNNFYVDILQVLKHIIEYLTIQVFKTNSLSNISNIHENNYQMKLNSFKSFNM